MESIGAQSATTIPAFFAHVRSPFELIPIHRGLKCARSWHAPHALDPFGGAVNLFLARASPQTIRDKPLVCASVSSTRKPAPASLDLDYAGLEEAAPPRHLALHLVGKLIG